MSTVTTRATAVTGTAAGTARRPLVARLLPEGIDYPLLLAVLLLASLGLLMVASASMTYAGHNYGDEFFFVKRHLIYLLMGSLVALVVLRVPMATLYSLRGPLVIGACVLLVLVLIPGIGREVNGARRWIGLGLVNLQVAEVAKVVSILFIAGYLHRHQFEIREVWHSFLKPMAVILFMVLLLLMQPDFGSSVVILATVMGLFFLGGVRLWIFGGTLLLGAGSLALLAIMSPYRMARLVTFMDPWSDQFDSGYQLVQSLIAFGRGEWFGVGLGNSVQKLFYLPEAHTDFVFAVFAEEMGLFGVVFVVAVFVFLVYRILTIAQLAVQRENWFCAYLAFGVAIMVAGQAFINIGVTSGLLPTKGLTLPFISYGGSSLIISLAMIAMVLRVGKEMRNEGWNVGRSVNGGV